MVDGNDTVSVMKRVTRDDRGAAALLVAAGMILFMGMAALAIDLGFAFNERRQDQSAVDAGVMAGALDAVNGPDAMVSQALLYVRSNLPTTYTNAEWQALWEGCIDPPAVRNAGGFNFVPLDAPAGWVVADSANWCVSIDAAEFLFRVRVPQQIIETTFGAVVGIEELETSAAAVARLSVGGGGVLPFGLNPGTGSGLVCLSDAPGGLAYNQCNGPEEGNFGTIQLLKFGSTVIPTNENCNGSNPGNLLAQNIAHGADHIVFRDLDGVDSNAVVDQCYLPNVDTLETDTGFPNNGLEEGLVGPVTDSPYTYTPRLEQAGPLVSKFGELVNNTPLWTYLDGSATYGGNPLLDDAPSACDPASFTGGPPTVDWDGDGNNDPDRSWQHMNACIQQYVSGGYSGVMFTTSIETNPARFVYVPEFWDAMGPGSADEHIRYFKPAYLQGVLWRKQGGGSTPTDWILENPGESCFDADGGYPPGGLGYIGCNPPANWRIVQLTAFVIPDSALPESIRGSAIGGTTGVNPFATPELYR